MMPSSLSVMKVEAGKTYCQIHEVWALGNFLARANGM